MGTCKSCKHWGSETYWYFDQEGDEHKADAHRKCELIKLGGDWNYERPPDTTLPFLMDGSGYKADLWTPGAWSCPRFEAKQPPQEAP